MKPWMAKRRDMHRNGSGAQDAWSQDFEACSLGLQPLLLFFSRKIDPSLRGPLARMQAFPG